MANELMTLLEQEKPTLTALLQGHPALTADKMAQLLLSATRGSYYLRMVADSKTGHPETLIAALLQAAAVGLEPNTPLQHCALIPRKAKDGKWTANFQLMFRGRMHLAVVHGGIIDWQGEAVYKQDHFLYKPSSRTDPIEHMPELDSAKRPEDLRGAYVIITLPSGARRAKWMPIGEIMSIAKRSSDSYKAFMSDRSKDDTPWVQRPGEMAIKTVANNIYKQIVLTSPPPVQIGGELWERGPAAAERLPDDEIEDAELTEDELPRAKENHATATVRPNPEEPSGHQEPARSNHRTDNPAVVGVVPVREVTEQPRLHTVVEAIEEVEASESGDREVSTDEARMLADAVEKNRTKPKQLALALDQFGVESYEQLKVSQIPAFLNAVRGSK